MTIIPARTQQVQRTVAFVGTLFANEEVTIASEVDGRIAIIYADLGDRVPQGRVLAKIEDSEFGFAEMQAEESLREVIARLGLTDVPPPFFDVTKTSLVMKAKAELDDAQANLKRIEDLHKANFISTQERDTVAMRYATASATYKNTVAEAKALVASAYAKEAALAIARKKLQDTMIAAPLAGSINERVVAPGEYVKVGDKVFTLVQDHPLKLRGMIPERFAPEVRTGQPIALRVDAFPGRIFQGTLARISPSAEVTSRAFLVEALIDNPEHVLKPNFFANAEILTHTDAHAVTIPQQALVTFAGVTKVFVVTDGTAREREVRAGMRVGANEVEVTQGVAAGESVVISGLTRLTNGAAVTVKESLESVGSTQSLESKTQRTQQIQ
ncbi:MAG: efflux RND transporter periplasmic adaptor subunit [Candidatus Binatia bacterium]